MKIYFAHPISTYCSSIEQTALTLLKAVKYEVINPSEEEHQKNCGPDMNNWVALAQTAEAIAILPFKDGSIGAGVAAEALGVFEQNKPVFLFTPDGNNLTRIERFPGSLKVLSVEETRNIIRPFKEDRIKNGLSPIPTYGESQKKHKNIIKP